MPSGSRPGPLAPRGGPSFDLIEELLEGDLGGVPFEAGGLAEALHGAPREAVA